MKSKKKGILIILIILVAVFLFSTLNFYLFFNNTDFSYSNLSGKVIGGEINLGGYDISLIIFILQWVVLFIVILIAFLKFRRHKKFEDVRINYSNLKKHKPISGTDLDTLYELLKDKRSLSISSIAKVFKLTKEKALEWAKILENSNLVGVEYPAFNEPEVRINRKEEIKIDERRLKHKKKKENKDELIKQKLNSSKAKKVLLKNSKQKNKFK